MRRALFALMLTVAASWGAACAQILGADFDVHPASTGGSGGAADAGPGDAGDASACDAARCPVVLASGFDFPWDVAVRDGEVYFTARVDPELPKGLVVRVSRDGGAPVELATGQLSPDRLYVTETDVYWTNFHADGGVYRVARSGQGKVQDVAPGQRGAIGVTVDATHVYWVADGQLRQLAIGATGPGDPVTSTVYDTPSFVVHDATSSYLFVSELASLGRVRRIAIDGGQDDILVEGQGSPNALAIQGDVLFFSTMTDAGAVHSVPTAGGGVTVIRNGLIQPAGIAVDDTYVYWASFIEKGTVARARIDGSGPVEVLADGQDWPNGVAVDEAFVYWTNHVEGGTVMKVAKEAAAQ